MNFKIFNNFNNFFKNNYKDIIIIILIAISISIFLHLLNCSSCDGTKPKNIIKNIDAELEEFLENLYFAKNNIENFQMPTYQDMKDAKLVSALQENYIIENVDNIKKLLNVDTKIGDLKSRVSRIINKINDKYETTTKQKIFINTNGEVSLLNV